MTGKSMKVSEKKTMSPQGFFMQIYFYIAPHLCFSKNILTFRSVGSDI